MDGIQLDVYRWLTELEDYVAANLLKICSVDLKYIDIAFGLYDDVETIINDVDIYVPLKQYKTIEQYSVLTNSIEEAFRELGQSQGVYARNINWLPMVTTVAAVKVYDAFISHASEDKESIVRSLAEQLASYGFIIWYDELELQVGDSLRQTIDKGLAMSKYGIVILSKAFFDKNWTQYELNGLMAREMDGRKVILPVWHNITKAEVMKYSPTLADKVALDSSKVDIAKQLAAILNK